LTLAHDSDEQQLVATNRTSYSTAFNAINNAANNPQAPPAAHLSQKEKHKYIQSQFAQLLQAQSLFQRTHAYRLAALLRVGVPESARAFNLQ
jgi:hypothetical protein